LADFVLINKRDLADEHTLKGVIAQVQNVNPRARVLLTEYGIMDYNLVLDREGESTRPAAQHHQAPVHDHFHTLTVLCEAPLVRERFEHLIRSLPPTVWRAKGFVRFTNSDEQWMFQFIAGDFAIEWIDLLPEPPEHVVFIGKEFDRETLRGALLACAP